MVKQYILRLKILVNHILAMQIVQSNENLPAYTPHLICTNPPGISLNELPEVPSIHVLQYQIELVPV